jgi:hypothetical protein
MVWPVLREQHIRTGHNVVIYHGGWYQHLLGLRSDHGGSTDERLVTGDTLVLQLHRFESDHHHGTIGDPERGLGNGVLLWFGETADFDEVVARAAELGATIVLPPLRNPPEGEGNGPGHREIWLKDPDGYTVVVASPTARRSSRPNTRHGLP